jgi:hypothetical protein
MGVGPKWSANRLAAASYSLLVAGEGRSHSVSHRSAKLAQVSSDRRAVRKSRWRRSASSAWRLVSHGPLGTHRCVPLRTNLADHCFEPARGRRSRGHPQLSTLALTPRRCLGGFTRYRLPVARVVSVALPTLVGSYVAREVRESSGPGAVRHHLHLVVWIAHATRSRRSGKGITLPPPSGTP